MAYQYGYGSKELPVSLDPFQRIVGVHWPQLPKFVAVQTSWGGGFVNDFETRL